MTVQALIDKDALALAMQAQQGRTIPVFVCNLKDWDILWSIMIQRPTILFLTEFVH